MKIVILATQCMKYFCIIPGFFLHWLLITGFIRIKNKTMSVQPLANLCKVGRNLAKRSLPKVYPQWKIDLGNEIKHVFENNEKVLVLHYTALNSQEWNDFRYNMRQVNCRVKIYPNKLTQIYLAKTIYTNLSQLFITDTCVAYGGADVNIASVLKHLNATSKIELLGGTIENCLMNRSQIIAYSQLPSIDQLRAEMVAILSQPAQKLFMLLQSNQTSLSRSLDQYSKQLESSC